MLGDLEEGTDAEADAQGQQVVDEHHQEDILDALQEGFDVAHEGQDDHRDEEDDAEPLERFLQLLGHLGQELGGQHAEGEGTAQQDEDGLEDVPEGDDQLRDIARDIREMEVEAAVEPEVERGRQDGEGRADGRQADGKLHVGLGQRAHEVGDVAAGAGGHQDHAQGHRPADPAAEKQGQQEGEQRQQDQLADHSEDQGFGLAEDVSEQARADAQGDAVHHESQDDVDGIHAARVERDVYAVYNRGDFRTHSTRFIR